MDSKTVSKLAFNRMNMIYNASVIFFISNTFYKVARFKDDIQQGRWLSFGVDWLIFFFTILLLYLFKKKQKKMLGICNIVSFI